MKICILPFLLTLILTAGSVRAESAQEITQRHYKEMLEELETYVKENPEAADAEEAYENAIQAAYMSKNTDKVVSLLELKYEKLLDENPLNMETFLQSGMMLAQYASQNDRRDVAEKVYNDLKKIDETHDDPMLSQALTMLKSSLNTPQIGDTPTLAGTTLEGNEISLADYEGKVVLLDFWATWCGPCIAELPNVKKVYETYHEKGFEIIGISLDRSKEPLVNMVEDKDLDWVHLYDQDQKTSLADKFSITAIPTMYLLDKEGKIAALNPRGAQLEKEVAALMDSE